MESIYSSLRTTIKNLTLDCSVFDTEVLNTSKVITAESEEMAVELRSVAQPCTESAVKMW